eukprot:58727-Chlamydomonas_euryale.AAC.2
MLAHACSPDGDAPQVSVTAGEEMKMVVPKGGIWGTAGVGGLSVDFNDKGELRATLQAVPWRLQLSLAVAFAISYNLAPA